MYRRNIFVDLHGDEQALQVRSFDAGQGAAFEEYVIETQPFKFDKWLSYTVILSAVFLHVGLHHQHASLLTTLCVTLIILAISKMHIKVKKESLLVIKAVGMQVTTIFASGRKSAKFIAWERIQGVVINEAVTMHQVLFYLAILLHSSSSFHQSDASASLSQGNDFEILPVFQHTLPRLDCLKQVYRSVHRIVNECKMPNRLL